MENHLGYRKLTDWSTLKNDHYHHSLLFLYFSFSLPLPPSLLYLALFLPYNVYIGNPSDQYQITSLLIKINLNVYEMLALTMDTETIRKPLTFTLLKIILVKTSKILHQTFTDFWSMIFAMVWYCTNKNFLLLNHINYVIHIIYTSKDYFIGKQHVQRKVVILPHFALSPVAES